MTLTGGIRSVPVEEQSHHMGAWALKMAAFEVGFQLVRMLSYGGVDSKDVSAVSELSSVFRRPGGHKYTNPALRGDTHLANNAASLVGFSVGGNSQTIDISWLYHRCGKEVKPCPSHLFFSPKDTSSSPLSIPSPRNTQARATRWREYCPRVQASAPIDSS